VHGHQQPANAVLLPLVVAPVAVMAGMLLPALSKAKGKAQSISCVNNLKQIGLAARIFAVDHEDNFPPSFLAMTNELVSPRVLICPQDPGAASAAGATWSNWDVSRSSYVYVAPGLKEGKVDPQTVVFRCRVHGHEGLADGSVRQAPGAR
jgi:hypothetical protein